MQELGLFLLIGGPIVGLLVLLVGIIQLFTSGKTEQGKRTVLVGFIILVGSALIGFSICSLGIR